MIRTESNQFAAILALYISIILTFSHCKSNTAPAIKPEPEVQNVSDVIFFVENSGSMFGYVDKANEFKRTVVGVAYLPEFDSVPQFFYLINGTSNPQKDSEIYINYLGDDPDVFKENLSTTAFNVGDVRYSDLNKMFQIALDSTRGNRITVLISDCIYDVGEDSDPIIALNIESEKTQRSFRNRLKSENIQTVMLKASSNFNGTYYYASQNGSKKLDNVRRPFYVIFFGKGEILNNILTERNLSKIMEGPLEIARFFVNDEKEIHFQIVPSVNRRGDFRVDPNNPSKLKKAKPIHNEFQFAIAAELSSLPFSESYLEDISNYECSLPNFSVVNVTRINKKMPGVQGSHLITLFTDKHPSGILNLVLKNVTPEWIFETNSENEAIIDSTHTYGFTSLTNAVSKAYNEKNLGTNAASFKIEITN